MTTKDTSCIVLITDLNYVKYAAYLVSRIFKVQENQKRIFVLTMDVTESDFRCHFDYPGVVQVDFNLDKLLEHGIQPQGHVSIATYAKILIPTLIPEEFTKALYMDIDLYIVEDLQPIFDFPLNRAIAANQFENGEANDLFGDYNSTYFSAGVMLLDLLLWRSEQISEKLIELLQKYPKLPRGDNDLLNIYFKENWQPLPLCFNFMAELPLNGHLYNKNIRPIIVHLVGSRKPWGKRGHTIWHVKWRREFLELFPGQLELTVGDATPFRFLRWLWYRFPIFGVLIPRKMKDLILIWAEK